MNTPFKVSAAISAVVASGGTGLAIGIGKMERAIECLSNEHMTICAQEPRMGELALVVMSVIVVGLVGRWAYRGWQRSR